MKTILPIVLIAIAAGFAVGWFSRTPEQTSDNSDTARSRGNRTASSATSGDEGGHLSKRTPRKSTAKKDTAGAWDKERAAEWESKSRDMLKTALNRKNETRIKKLVRELGLNAEQERQLRAFFEKKTLAMINPKLDKNGGTTAADMAEYFKYMKSEGLDGELAGILSEEQKEAYEKLRERERKSAIESRAMSQLAKLQRTLDLKEDQKDAVYQILMEDAAKSVDKQGATGGVISTISSAFGVNTDHMHLDFDPTDLAGGDNKTPKSKEEIMKSYQERQQRRIDEQVERLAPVLDEDQLKQYRENLTNQGNIFGGLLETSEVSPDGGSSIIIRQSIPATEKK